MARDPDTLETTETEPGSGTQATAPGLEFATPPSRAERTMPRTRQPQPLWPWLAVLALILAGVLVYLAVT